MQYSPVMLLPDLRRFSSAIQTNWVQKELLCKVLPGAFWERRRLATDQGRITTFRYPRPAFLKGKNKKTKKRWVAAEDTSVLASAVSHRKESGKMIQKNEAELRS